MHLKKNECYLKYCAFLQAIKKELHSLNRKTHRIYEIEMLLFTIAPTFITEDIRNRVTLRIDRPIDPRIDSDTVGDKA